MQVIDRIALILTIVGGLNWGSIGLSGLISWRGSAAGRPPWLRA